MPTCRNCADTGWVCENHDNVPWAGLLPDDACQCCGAPGMPCPVCNPCDDDGPLKGGVAREYSGTTH